MTYNWQTPDWPDFRFDSAEIERLEASFLRQGGMLMGAFLHLQMPDAQAITVEVLTRESLTTSAIEGEILNRESVRGSILGHLGIAENPVRVGPREQGISQLAVSFLHTATEPLREEILFDWHRMVMLGSSISRIGAYRTGSEPMQIVSGEHGRERVHFEAPPSDRVPAEMQRFLEWFNQSERTSPGLTRASIAHLYFESIHPFEDGNGRIGRAISEKALSQALGKPSLTMLSTEIESRRKDYYDALQRASRDMEITDWIVWFGETVLTAQKRTQSWLDFLIWKSKLLDRIKGELNQRQEMALQRLFREGPKGFEGGMSAGNYQRITGAAPATAGRDLVHLVELGVLRRTGEGKGTRYWPNCPL